MNATEQVIYAGDAGAISRRVLQSHCTGNVEASALRQHVATHLGFRLRRSRRPSGTTQIRIDSPDPKDSESAVTAFIRSGFWRYVICDSAEEAKDFQWYAIEQLRPLLNVNYRISRRDMRSRYAELFSSLTTSLPLSYQQFPRSLTSPGVYVLYHNQIPSSFA